MTAAFYLAATILAVPPMFKRGFQSQGLFGDKGEEVCYLLLCMNLVPPSLSVSLWPFNQLTPCPHVCTRTVTRTTLTQPPLFF